MAHGWVGLPGELRCSKRWQRAPRRGRQRQHRRRALLLAKGAESKASDSFDYARAKGHDDVVRLLEAAKP
jgi:hypothetical protein